MSRKQPVSVENRIWEHPLTIVGLVSGIGLIVAGLWSLYAARWIRLLQAAYIASRDGCLTAARFLEGYPLMLIAGFLFILLISGLTAALYKVSLKMRRDKKLESKQGLLKRSAAKDAALARVLADIEEKTGFNAPVCLIRSEKPVCLVQGLFKPTIIISTAICEKLTEEELETAVLHEISHLKAKDPLKRMAVEFVADWLFFVPLMRSLSVHLGYLQEVLADSYASRVSGKPATLASAIVKIATTDDLGLATPLGQSHLTGRVKRLLGVRQGGPWRLGVISAVISLFFVATVIATPFAIGSEKVVSQNGNACAKQCLVAAEKGQASACAKACAEKIRQH